MQLTHNGTRWLSKHGPSTAPTSLLQHGTTPCPPMFEPTCPPMFEPTSHPTFNPLCSAHRSAEVHVQAVKVDLQLGVDARKVERVRRCRRVGGALNIAHAVRRAGHVVAAAASVIRARAPTGEAIRAARPLRLCAMEGPLTVRAGRVVLRLGRTGLVDVAADVHLEHRGTHGIEVGEEAVDAVHVEPARHVGRHGVVERHDAALQNNHLHLHIVVCVGRMLGMREVWMVGSVGSWGLGM
eukprot:84038-Chlamydomonas_euryale.AAC.1